MNLTSFGTAPTEILPLVVVEVVGVLVVVVVVPLALVVVVVVSPVILVVVVLEPLVVLTVAVEMVVVTAPGSFDGVDFVGGTNVGTTL